MAKDRHLLSLDTNTVDLWYGEILNENEDEEYQYYWSVLDESEKNQANRFKIDVLHHRYVTVHGRLRNILAQYSDQSPESIILAKTERGKPYLADNPELSFNLSHSENFMAIAVARNCQIGVDIELYKHRDSLSAIVNKYFAVEETVYWNKQPEKLKLREFYCFWTRKEAFLKATGLGIAYGLNDCVINPEQPGYLLSIPSGCGKISDWQLRDIDLGQYVCCALAMDKAITGVKLYSF